MAIGKPKPARRLWSALKDKVSALRAAALLLSGDRTAAAVLIATSHNPSSSPPPHLAADLLLLSRHRPSAAADALLLRLRKTHDAFVALKCLLTLHRILRHHPHHRRLSGLLNLSDFLDPSDPDTWQLSLWARWFAAEIDHSLSLPVDRKISALSNAALVAELAALVSMVEQLATAPESLHYQKIGIIHDAVKLAGEDYRLAMREIFARIREIDGGGRLVEFSGDELDEVIGVISRLEGYEEKMVSMFLNKKRYDGVWEAIRAAKEKAGEEKRRREDSAVVLVAGLTRCTGGELTRRTRGGRWLDVEWNKSLTVTTA